MLLYIYIVVVLERLQRNMMGKDSDIEMSVDNNDSQRETADTSTSKG